MPTPLPTAASPTDLRAPIATPQRAAKPSASEPSFSETLSEKSSSLSDDPVAGPAPAGEAPDPALDHTPDTEAGPAKGDPNATNTGQPTGIAAQETPDDAQGLSLVLPVGTTATGPPPGVVTDLLQTDGQTGPAGPAPTPALTPTPAPAPAVNPDPVPTLVAPTPGSTVVEPQSGRDQPQLQQNPTSQVSSVIPAVGDGQTTTAGTDREAHSGDTDRGQHQTPSPATGRAVQVQAGVAVQNVTGHTPAPAPVVSPTGVSVATPASGPADLGLEDAPKTSAGVARGLTAMLNQRGGSMTMRLDPPALGQLRVQMTVARGAVTVQFQPATLEAQALLERSLATLRTALESQGLSVERLTVHAAPAPAASREAAEDQSQQQQQASRHHADAGEGRSRGRGDEPTRDGRQSRRGTNRFAEAFENTGAKAA